MRTCIGCGMTGAAVVVDGDGFEVCPACHYNLRADLITGVRNFELYLECWAAWRAWEEAHPVAARILAYTEREDG